MRRSRQAWRRYPRCAVCRVMLYPARLVLAMALASRRSFLGQAEGSLPIRAPPRARSATRAGIPGGGGAGAEGRAAPPDRSAGSLRTLKPSSMVLFATPLAAREDTNTAPKIARRWNFGLRLRDNRAVCGDVGCVFYARLLASLCSLFGVISLQGFVSLRFEYQSTPCPRRRATTSPRTRRRRLWPCPDCPEPPRTPTSA